MATPRRIEWLNKNRYRRYPFIEDQTLSTTGLTIPDDVILDFQMVTFRHPGSPLRLTRVTIVDPGGVRYATFRFTFDFPAAGWNAYVEFTVPASAVFPYQPNSRVASEYNAWAIFGEATEDFINDATPGTYTFATQVEPALISYQDTHRVESIVANMDGETPQDTLVGNVEIQEGYNCQIGVSSGLNRITISGIVGAGAGIQCETMEEDEIDCSNVLLRINGLHADDNGNFMLLAGDGMVAIADPENHRVILRTVQPKEELVCGGMS